MRPSSRFIFLLSIPLIVSLQLIASDNLPAARQISPDTVVVRMSYARDQAPLELTVKQLLELYKIPGLSIAVIHDYKIAWAKGFGVTAPGGRAPVTTTTLFQAGSISKPVATIGALSLVEHGKLSLDEDVNQKLKTWKVPENEFTRTEKVTLRRLMSHMAGLTVHGFPGYEVGQPVPTLVQIFDGEKPSNTPPVRVESVPGTRMNYSGGGVTIEQQLMIDVTGEPFPKFMQDTVLTKIGMTNSTYEQPLPADRAMHTATGTLANGEAVAGRWHVYPEMAAAGLWTTPTDLAKVAIEIALSKQGKANHVLSQKMVREMLSLQTPDDGTDPTVGLGFFLNKNNPGEFGHGGADEGFQAQLTMLADSGDGIAMMGNSDFFFALAPYVVETVARGYGWKYTADTHSSGELLGLVARAKGTEAALAFYREMKQGSEHKLNEGDLNFLGYQLMQLKRTDDAIKVFQLNVQEYPNAWNPYDSLAEAYMNAGQKDLAIQNYEKSLALNPNNKNGAERLKKLKGTN